MPILDLQKRLVELGRIRQGTTTPATSRSGRAFDRPVKLDTWRMTSRDETLIRAAADLYGGQPAPWRDGAEWEVITGTDQLDILVIPGQTLSQWWELWAQPDGKGAVSCLRRCDGQEQTDGSPCACPPDYDERRDAAAGGTACKPITRLSVVLPHLPGIGQWRLEARGYYAAVELAAATSLIEKASQSGALLPARLRLEQRTKAVDGQTISYRVPVVAVDVTPIALADVAGAETLTRPERPGIGDGLDAADAQRDREHRQGRRAAPLGPPAIEPTTKPIGDDDEPPQIAPAPEPVPVPEPEPTPEPEPEPAPGPATQPGPGPGPEPDPTAYLEAELLRIAGLLDTVPAVESAIATARAAKTAEEFGAWLSRQIRVGTAKVAGEPAESLFQIPASVRQGDQG
jgi:hypothetical protein